MDIRKTGPPGLPSLSGRRGLNPHPGRNEFRVSRAESALPEQPLESVGSLRRVSSEFTKADMADPVKRNEIVRRSFQELLEIEFPGVQHLDAAQKQRIAGWMAADPILRSKMIGHLQRILR